MRAYCMHDTCVASAWRLQVASHGDAMREAGVVGGVTLLLRDPHEPASTVAVAVPAAAARATHGLRRPRVCPRPLSGPQSRATAAWAPRCSCGASRRHHPNTPGLVAVNGPGRWPSLRPTLYDTLRAPTSRTAWLRGRLARCRCSSRCCRWEEERCGGGEMRRQRDGGGDGGRGRDRDSDRDKDCG